MALENIIAHYKTNAENLMSTADSQSNEALNHVAWSKAIKVRNYNLSESFDFRVSAYINQVIQETLQDWRLNKVQKCTQRRWMMKRLGNKNTKMP